MVGTSPKDIPAARVSRENPCISAMEAIKRIAEGKVASLTVASCRCHATDNRTSWSSAKAA